MPYTQRAVMMRRVKEEVMFARKTEHTKGAIPKSTFRGINIW